MSDRPLSRRALIGAGIAGAGLLAAPARAAAPNVGLIFVAAGWCPYCAAIAPVLYDLHRSSGMPVLVATTDARPVAPFASFEMAATHPLTAELGDVPHVLVWHRRLDRVTHHIRGFRDMRHFVLRLSAALRQVSAL